MNGNRPLIWQEGPGLDLRVGKRPIGLLVVCADLPSHSEYQWSIRCLREPIGLQLTLDEVDGYLLERVGKRGQSMGKCPRQMRFRIWAWRKMLKVVPDSFCVLQVHD